MNKFVVFFAFYNFLGLQFFDLVNISRIISLAKSRISNFSGVKDSSSNLEQIVHAIDSDVTIFLETI
uniref:CSON005125 protein n=1 Tax=Culicoides sonorensis TaxID=179676 RepID=A0A336MSM5_CULSO